MAKEEQGASLKPSDAAAGGVIDDCDVEIMECRFVDDFDYGGTRDSVFALRIEFKSEDYADNPVQHFTAGDLERWQPSQDGLRAVPIGSATALNKNCNAVLFLASLVNCGFPEEKIEQDVDVFEGTQCHVKQIPQPDRPGLKKDPENKGVILVADKIHAYPWDKKSKGKGKAKGRATAKAKEEEVPADGAVEEKAIETVIKLITKAKGSATYDEISTAAFRELSKDPLRNPAIQLIAKKSFLENGPWTYEDGTLSMGD